MKSNIPTDHNLKINKYYDLRSCNSYNAIEVGVQGILAESLYYLIKANFRGQDGLISSFIDHIFESGSIIFKNLIK